MLARAFAKIGDTLLLLLIGLVIFAVSDWLTGKGMLRDSPGSVVIGLIIGMAIVLTIRQLRAAAARRNSLR